MIFKWKDAFCTGIEEIDAQHKRLFELGSELYEMVVLDDGIDHYDELVEILNNLKDYTVYHFQHEESLMKKYNYEQFEQHKIEHDKFIDKINEVETDDIDEKQKKIILNMIEFIANWISNHILKTDFRYREHLGQNMNK